MASGKSEIVLEGGPELAAALRAAPSAMKVALRKSHRDTAKFAGTLTRSAAAGASPQQRHMAGGIGWGSNSASAIMTLRNTAGAPGAMGAFLGAKKYPQFPRAIAPGWTVAGPGGPLVINPTLHKHEGDIDTVFLEGQVQAVARAKGAVFR